MYIASELINEIYSFLKELNSQKISLDYQYKLCKIIEKLDTFFNRFDNQTPAIEEEENVYEIPIKSTNDTQNTLELPTKLGSDKLPPEMTLTGLLYYRYEPQLWERYPYSYLYYHRLICEKNIPSYNNVNNYYSNNNNLTNYSKNSGVCLFLMGYTAVETGKDSGMNYVFKLTHPMEETKVFATETEEECSKWVEQINLYANGLIPTEHKNFSRSSTQPVEIFTEPCDTGQYYDTTDSNTVLNDVILEDSLVNSDTSHLRRQSADIMNLISNSSIQTKTSINLPDGKFNRSRSSYCSKNPIINQFQLSQPPSQSGTLNSNNNSYNSNKLISSVRRKVESIGHKYRNRKSFAGFSNTSGVVFNPILQTNNNNNNITAPLQSGCFNTTNESTVTQIVEQHKLRSKTMPQISPIDAVLVSGCNALNVSNSTIASNISRKKSSGSNNYFNKICFPQHKDALFSGVAKLRIQGNNKSGWIERWCQLKPQLLECYHLPSNTPNNISNGSNSHTSPSNTAKKMNTNSANGSMEEPILDFALCLEDLNLDISNDKKHRSALRLSCDSIKQDLLFEVLDKVVMGGWIKAFIEALGLNKKGLKCDSKQTDSEKENIKKSELTDVSSNHNPKFESEGSSSIVREQIYHFKDPESLTDSDLLLQHQKSPDVMQRSLTTIHSESIYDEVTTPDFRAAHGNRIRSRDNSFHNNRSNVIQEHDDMYQDNQITKKLPQIIVEPINHYDDQNAAMTSVPAGRAYNRRWSTPALLEFFVPPAAPSVIRRNIKDHPLPSLPASTPDSENNSDSVSDVTPIGTIHSQGSSTIENRVPTLKTTTNLTVDGSSTNADIVQKGPRGISKDDLDLLVSKKHLMEHEINSCFLDEAHHPCHYNNLPTINDTGEMMSTSLYTHPPDTNEDNAYPHPHYYHTADHRSTNNHNHLSCQDKTQNGCSLADLIARFNEENDSSILSKLTNNTVSSNGSHSNSQTKSASSTITNSTNTTDDSLVNTTCRNLHSSFFNTSVSSSSNSAGNRCSNSASIISVKSCDTKFPHNSTSLTSSSSSSSNPYRPKLCRSTTSSSAHQYNHFHPHDQVQTVCKSFSADLSNFSEQNNELVSIPPTHYQEAPMTTEPSIMENIPIVTPTYQHHYNSYQAKPSVPLRNNDEKKEKERPKSLMVKKNSTDLIFEEISSVKEDIKNLKKRKKHLKRNKTKPTNSKALSSKETSNDSSTLSDIINSIDSQLNFKENRLKELSNHSKKQKCLADGSSKVK